MGFIPLSAQASTPKLSCTVTVTVGSEETHITKKGDIIVPEGGSFTVEWEGKNAKTAELDGDTIAVSGTDTFSPENNGGHKFVFKNGSKKVTCQVSVHVANGSVTDVSSGTRPTLSGEVSGTKKVSVAIYDKEGKAVFEKKNISVKHGKWTAKVAANLEKGDYEVRLSGDSKYKINTITTSTLTIGDTKNTLSANGSSEGILNVSTIPLLGGGTTRAAASVPVMYLQLRNMGSEAVHVTGFDLRQNGSASANGILSLSTVDDKGGSRGASAMNPFINNTAVAPTDATIEPGAVKLFTIKANLGTNVTIGTNLMLDVIGVESNGTETGAFPLRGTTWAIGY
jgi:flagellar hook assembly protein FlgD